MNFSLLAIMAWVSSSLTEPWATDKWFRNSPQIERPCPSAIFAGTDTAARRICAVSPNRSSIGLDADSR